MHLTPTPPHGAAEGSHTQYSEVCQPFNMSDIPLVDGLKLPSRSSYQCGSRIISMMLDHLVRPIRDHNDPRWVYNNHKLLKYIYMYISIYPVISHYIPIYPHISPYIPLYPIVPPYIPIYPHDITFSWWTTRQCPQNDTGHVWGTPTRFQQLRQRVQVWNPWLTRNGWSHGKCGRNTRLYRQ